MVALPFLRMPSPTAIAEDTKAMSTSGSTNSGSRSRSASETEQPALVESILPGPEAVQNERLKAAIQRLSQTNLGLRIKFLDRENAFLRFRMQEWARDLADVALPGSDEEQSEEDAGPTPMLADSGCAPWFPSGPPGLFTAPDVWVDPRMEEAHMAAWSASTGSLPAPKASRSSRRRAARRTARTARATGVFAPAHDFEASLAMWESWAGQWPGFPQNQGWQVEPGALAAMYAGVGGCTDDSHGVCGGVATTRRGGCGDDCSVDDEDQPVVALDDSGEEQADDEEERTFGVSA